MATKKPYLTAKEATAWLGIKRETLYAYVSRGFLRTLPDANDSHARLYVREDLEALKARSAARRGHAPAAASALRWGEPVLETAVSCVDFGRLTYRGYDAVELMARGFSFENTAELLWSGVLPLAPVVWDDVPRARVKGALEAEARAAGERAAASWYRRTSLRLAWAQASDDDAAQETSLVATVRARNLIRLLARRDSAPSTESVAGLLAARFVPRLAASRAAAAVAAIDMALVASADHELNSSTFAARIAASTGAELFASIQAGVGAMSGPRHGGAFDLVEDFLDLVRSAKDARGVISAAAAEGRAIPGFGHRLYPDGDPRSAPLIAAATRLAPPSLAAEKRLGALFAVGDAAQSKGSPPPSLDFALVAVTTALGMPRGSANALFTVGRIAGWTAHILEQRLMDFQLRPRARYTGRASVGFGPGAVN